MEAEKRGDFATAIAQFREAINHGADGPDIRSDLGIAYFEAGDNKEALRQFRQALTTRPEFVPANVFSGLALLKLQRPKEAIPFLEKAYAARPGAPEIVLALARAEVASNNIVRANELYEKAARLDSESAEAWFGVGVTERALAETEAKRARRLGQMKPGSAAETRVKQLLADSEAATQKGLALDPNSVRAEMVFAESLRIAERYEDAIREYLNLTRQQPDFAPAWAGLAAAYSASGDNDKAIEAAVRATELDPSDADADVLMAGLFLRAGDSGKAKPYALRAVQLWPGVAAAHLVLAKVYLAEGNSNLAIAELKQATAGDTDGSAYYLLATTLRKIGQEQEAAAAMRKFRQLHSGNGEQR